MYVWFNLVSYGKGALPHEKVTDVCQKIWIILLTGTNLGTATALFNLKKISVENWPDSIHP